MSIPIQEIENGIRDAEICFADITMDNPNIWFELGFAFAIPREVVLLCSDERETRYPFDVQHRTIIDYTTGVPQDYEQLKQDITNRIKAVLKKNEELGKIIHRLVVKGTEGLNQHEIVALATIMQNSFLTDGYVSGWNIRNDMNQAGFTDLAVSIALNTLITKGMIDSEIEHDSFGEPSTVYKTTDKGEEWLVKNQEKLILTAEPNRRGPKDDIPF